MAIPKINNAERAATGVTGLPDTPGLSTADMQGRFDGLGNLACDGVDAIADVLNSTDGANNINTSNGQSVEYRLSQLEVAISQLSI